MHLLILGTIAYSLFAITVRAAQRRSCNMLAVGMINYLVAAAVYVLLSRESGVPEWRFGLLGAASGIVFAVGYVVLAQTLRRKGLSLTTGITQLAVLFPVVAGIFLYAEQPSSLQVVGVVCALVALPLLALVRDSVSDGGIRSRAPGLALLVTAGTAMVLLQSVNHVSSGSSEERRLFFAILFSVALVTTMIAWAIFERRVTRVDLAYGAALGSWNATHGFMLVGAMKTLPGMVVWPAVSAGSLMLSVLVGVMLWDERLGSTARIGIGLALVAVVCINAGRG